MPRKQRMYLARAHVVQRDSNRDVCIFQGDDYPFYLSELSEAVSGATQSGSARDAAQVVSR